MSTMLYAMIGLFVFISVVTIVLAYKPVWANKCTLSGEVQLDELTVDENLRILSEKNEPIKKANAFVGLMQLSYVLIHTIITQGNNYDDKKQTKNFCEALTPQLVDSLNAMEGKYE